MVLVGLLYPAFLGSLIYNPVENFYKEHASGGKLKWPLDIPLDEFALIAALLSHFALDYIYSIDRDDNAPYDWLMFIADSAIVTFLFLSIQYALRSSGADRASVVVWLFLLATKIAAFVWELADGWHRGSDRNNERAVLMDLGFCYVYALGMLLLPDRPLVLASVVALDALFYVIHDHFAKREFA